MLELVEDLKDVCSQIKEGELFLLYIKSIQTIQ